MECFELAIATVLGFAVFGIGLAGSIWALCQGIEVVKTQRYQRPGSQTPITGPEAVRIGATWIVIFSIILILFGYTVLRAILG